MKQTFDHLLTFLFKHLYFSDSLFRSINVSFADGTQKLLKDLGIIIKPFPGGFYLLTSNPELLNSRDTTSIQLLLNCTDPFYINYTELPTYRLTDKLLYFNNLSVFSNEKNEGYLLHNEEFVGQNDVVQIIHEKFSPLNFNAEKGYRFTDAAGTEITSQFIALSVHEANTFIISNLLQGLILLYDFDEEVKKFYYFPNSVWKKPFAIVEIFPEKLFKQYNENGKIEYALNFNNRHTFWKYFLVSPVYKNFKNLSIINKGKEEIFSSPQKLPVHKNEEALVFESKKKIPLSELSDENYQLVDNYDNGKRKIILKNLTKASPEQLYRDETKSNEAIYSHIYI